jgi:hypothetical protein
MYTRHGEIAESRDVFASVQVLDLVSWNSLPLRYAQHGYGKEVVEQMRKLNVQPDHTTFLLVLTACSHAYCFGRERVRILLLDGEKMGFGSRQDNEETVAKIKQLECQFNPPLYLENIHSCLLLAFGEGE